MNSTQPISYRYIFRFWFPLALTWAMMAIEGPTLNAIVSNLPEQKDNLAAFGLAANIAMIIESPVIMLLSLTVALVRDGQSYHLLRRFTFTINAFVTLGMVVVVIPPVFDLVAYDFLRLNSSVATLLYKSLWYLLLWPASIGFRRFYQGLMIKQGQTRLVALGTIARMVSMAGIAVLLATLSTLPGAVIASVSLCSGVVLESIATRLMARQTVRGFESLNVGDALTLQRVNKMYIPLAMTSVMGMAVNPMLAFFMSRFAHMYESLAVLPVIDSFVFQFRSPGFSYQEVGIALLGENNRNLKAIRNFGVMLMVVTTVPLAIISFSDALNFVYSVFPYRLSTELANFATLPTRLLVLLPAFSVLYSLQRAVLINSHRTKDITISTTLEVLSIFLCLYLLSAWTALPGVVAASLALILSRVVANLWLNKTYRKCIQAS